MAECFILSSEAFRRIAFDLLLPEPILPGNDPRSFIKEMRRCDSPGRGYWRESVREHGAQDFASLFHLRALDAIARSRAAAGSGG